MSRSYKKHAICTDGRDGRKPWKRDANKVVRRYKHKIANGKDYKKLYCSWNIHDYISRWTWAEARADWEKEDSFYKWQFPTLKEFYRYWSKYYKRK